MDAKSKAYIAKIRELESSIDALDNDAYRRALRLLEEARVRIVGTISSAEGYDAYYLRKLKVQIEDTLSQFRSRYGAEIIRIQEEAWTAGIAMAEEPAIIMGFDKPLPGLSRTQLEILQGYSSDLITSLTADATKRINGVLVRGVLGEADLNSMIKEVGKNLKDPSVFKTIAGRAEAIVRTEMGNVFSAATDARLNQMAVSDPDLKQKWLHRHIANYPRPSHVAADGQVVDIGKTFNIGGVKMRRPHDPAAPAKETIMCFPGETKVFARNIEKLYRRWYRGELVEITTARNNKLSGTPNHPILADEGWVALGDLKKGDYLINCCLGQEVAVADPNIQNVPTTISEIFDSATYSWGINRMRGCDVDFHGDGFDGKVDIITTDGLLESCCEAAISKPGSQHLFSITDLRTSLLSCYSRLTHTFFGGRLATNSSMSRSRERLSLKKRHMDCTETGSLTTTSFINAEIIQNAINDPAANSELMGQSLSRSPIQIQLDKVIAVRKLYFSGHVYNLQTSSSVYISNNIIAHNCKCRAIPWKEGWPEVPINKRVADARSKDPGKYGL